MHLFTFSLALVYYNVYTFTEKPSLFMYTNGI